MKLIDTIFTSQELSQKIQGVLSGSHTLQITGISSIESPQAGTLIFVRENSRSAEAKILSQDIGVCVLVAKATSLSDKDRLVRVTPAPKNAVIEVNDPYTALLDLLPLFYRPNATPTGIAPSAVISPTALISPTASIGAHCVIGDGVTIADSAVLFPRVTVYEHATIGKGVTLHAGVIIREECEIGAGCVIHNNSVIGADGFGYIPDPKVGLRKVPQLGKVIIGEHVEIGANSCIDRGAFGDTIIGVGTKIDNLVQVGHNVTIGRSSVLCGHVGVGGSVTIGDGCVIAGHTGVADHVKIASGVRVGGKSGVIGDLETPGDYLGFPAVPAKQWRRATATLNRISKRKETL